MPIKLFLLGRPGCGKSSAIRCIRRYTQNKQWPIIRFRDFDILKQMSNEERYKKAFVPTRYDGFDIVDLSVFDEALKRLDRRLNTYISNTNAHEIIMIEFARSDNIDAFHYISPSVKEEAYALFINTDIEECVRRVENRMIDPKSDDDHYVSEKAIREIYEQQVPPDANMFQGKFKEISNNGSKEEFEIKVDNFVDDFFKLK